MKRFAGSGWAIFVVCCAASSVIAAEAPGLAPLPEPEEVALVETYGMTPTTTTATEDPDDIRQLLRYLGGKRDGWKEQALPFPTPLYTIEFWDKNETEIFRLFVGHGWIASPASDGRLERPFSAEEQLRLLELLRVADAQEPQAA